MTRVYTTIEEAGAELERSVVTIGNFDGMHRGHQAIFAQVKEQAAQLGATPVAMTFDPHPVAFFRPEAAPAKLSVAPQKYALMGSYGVEAVVALRFDKALASMSPQAFIEEVLVEGLGAVEVVVGEDFRFGHQREGTTELLREQGERFGLKVVVPKLVEVEGEVVSSTRVRALVASGELEAVRRLLGRPHRLAGEVVHGEARGRALGFPTANLEVAEGMALPPDGVYATRLAVGGAGGGWQAITNIGTRPTFGGGARTVETFVLEEGVEEELDLYGEEVMLSLYRHVRPEMKFESPAALVAQIQDDVAQVRAYFEEGGDA
ncbi:bifunctional riboflavin kinase/FAD synthetase [Lujinxingia vulgaris]|uniref:Riboflavin biosynthesis protein n=1 Tax=Lujinxingia vulgaris TaxID=2600176 RepID=A0A5C6XC48_9DELT|nr:bifunctional riboflavin kinase/FAD synthetase [Lujinxingia vulgaris]TXD38991.1 bifunctional riboflavin kinase/FAD synthetase [Lujinxingia vulgaris]